MEIMGEVRLSYLHAHAAWLLDLKIWVSSEDGEELFDENAPSGLMST